MGQKKNYKPRRLVQIKSITCSAQGGVGKTPTRGRGQGRGGRWIFKKKKLKKMTPSQTPTPAPTLALSRRFTDTPRMEYLKVITEISNVQCHQAV